MHLPLCDFLYSRGFSDLAARLRALGLDVDLVRLPMSRHNIANYLCLADETVSRVLGRFARQGLVRTDRRSIRILEVEELQALALGIDTPVGHKARKQFKGASIEGDIMSEPCRSFPAECGW